MIHPHDEKKYTAVITNDENYDGVFFYGVTSTGIFCRPSCKSKAPKRENTQFFDSADDAIKAGFRACKRCRSDLLIFEPSKEIANTVKKVIDAMSVETAKLNVELTKIGLSQRQVIEVFKKEYGVTPKVYADTLRINEAKRQLLHTKNSVIDISMSIGFNSLSAFYRFFKEYTKCTPSLFRKENKK